MCHVSYSTFGRFSDGKQQNIEKGLDGNCSEISNVKDNSEDFNDIVCLTECDIPGASLNGKKPTELNVVQLKRWLACRGTPVSGKKAELIER